MSFSEQEQHPYPAILSDTAQTEDGDAISPFEGPEKLLEIWFAPSAAAVAQDDDPIGENGERRSGLRKVARERWEEMLRIVKCQVLSVVEGHEVDAYLLSESSLFISPHRLILKTCGTTLNLLGLPAILCIAASPPCQLTDVYRLFYSRKSFMFPERQQGPHREWKEEVAFLDRMFGPGHQKEYRGSGSAYTVGSVNRDHWLLYLTAPGVSEYDEMEPEMIPLPPDDDAARPVADFTIEILMSKLSASARRPFIFNDVPSPSAPTVRRPTTPVDSISPKSWASATSSHPPRPHSTHSPLSRAGTPPTRLSDTKRARDTTPSTSLPRKAGATPASSATCLYPHAALPTRLPRLRRPAPPHPSRRPRSQTCRRSSNA